MAFHSKKDFAELAGVKTKDLSVYIKRGKVTLQGELIDDKDQINQAFLLKREVNSAVKSEKKVSVKPDKRQTPIPDKREKTEAEEMFSLKSRLDMEKRQNEIDLQKLAIAKIRGEVVPVPAVKEIIFKHSESIKTAYIEASDNLLVIISQRNQMSAQELSELKKDFLKLVNKAIDSAVNATKVILTGVVTEYAKKRGVGQHD